MICHVREVPHNEEDRHAYRELIMTKADIGDCISGTILYDETTRQQNNNVTPFVNIMNDAGIILGIKVDTGAKKNMAGHPKVWTDCAT